MLRDISICFSPDEFARLTKAVKNKNKEEALTILSELEKVFKEREQAHCEMMISPKIKEDGLER